MVSYICSFGVLTFWLLECSVCPLPSIWQVGLSELPDLGGKPKNCMNPSFVSMPILRIVLMFPIDLIMNVNFVFQL